MNLLAKQVNSVEAPPQKSRRKVTGLRWAELRPEGPFPKTRPRRACVKRGHAYERVLGRQLQRWNRTGVLPGELRLSQWFLFSDSNGIGWAQTDAYLLTNDNRILLLEAKLTQTDSANPQLLSLYLPLLRHIYERPILCLQVCRNLRYLPPKLVDGPQELLDKPGAGVFTWHFRGDG